MSRRADVRPTNQALAPRRGRPSERAQASVSLLATVPALLVVGAVLVQVASVGFSGWSAGGAARAGARAVHVGESARPAARAALPGALRSRSKVHLDRESGRVRVRISAPRLLGLLPAIEVGASAAFRPEDAEQ